MPAFCMMGPKARTELLSVNPTAATTLSCSTNCWAIWAVTSILYWLSCTIKSICLLNTPPAELISSTASLAPLAAGRSREDSSPVRAKPPPILIVFPLLVVPPPQALRPSAMTINKVTILRFMLLSPFFGEKTRVTLLPLLPFECCFRFLSVASFCLPDRRGG